MLKLNNPIKKTSWVLGTLPWSYSPLTQFRVGGFMFIQLPNGTILRPCTLSLKSGIFQSANRTTYFQKCCYSAIKYRCCSNELAAVFYCHGKGRVHCRSPPCLRFVSAFTQHKTEEMNMTIINLRDYYQFYTCDCFIDVTEEVADMMKQAEKQEATYQRRVRRYKTYASWRWSSFTPP